MLGAAVLYLRAGENGSLPEFTGRVMHGVFFNTLSEISSGLAEFIHDELNLKPFSVSELVGQQKRQIIRRKFKVRQGDMFKWRIATLNEELLNAIAHLPLKYRFSINKIPMTLEKIIIDGEREAGTGAINDEELMAACMSMENFSSIRVRFVSPTTFKVNQNDYPLPLPKLFFSSLADKWQQAGMPADINKEYIKELAELIYPSYWQGKSGRTYLAEGRGVRTFKGEFVYELSALSLEERQIMLLLAQFGCFSGCGRMTGQGMGQIEVELE